MTPTPAPGPWRPSWPGSRDPGRLCVMATYQPDELTRQHPLHDTLAAMADAARPPERLVLEPFRRDELARLIELIEGERPSASVLLLVTERSRGNALIAEELLAARRELAGASLTGSLDELVIARLAGRSPECRRVLRLLAPAGEPLTLEQLATASLAFEREADRPAPRSSSSPRRGGGVLEADLGHGLAEALEHGFGRLEGLDGEDFDDEGAVADLPADAVVGIRHPLIARSIEADLLPGQRRRHHAALAEGLADRPGAPGSPLAGGPRARPGPDRRDRGGDPRRERRFAGRRPGPPGAGPGAR